MKSKKILCTLAFAVIISQGVLSSTTQVQATSSQVVTTHRLAGESRYDTSIAISQGGWDKADTVILTSGEKFADALCAGPLAKKYNGPILLTPSNYIGENTLNELTRLQAKNIILIGGTASISPNVEEKLKAAGHTNIERIAGKNRYETSAMIAKKLDKTDKIVIASGENFPDALSVSAVASKLGMPILLSPVNSLPEGAKEFIESNGIKETYIIGGEGALSSSIEKSVPSPVRLSGANRYATNLAIIKQFEKDLNFDNVYLTLGEGPTGDEFADALSGAALACNKSAPILLTNKSIDNDMNPYIKSKLNLNTKAIALGGQAVVPDSLIKTVMDEKTVVPVAKIYDKAGTYSDGEINGSVTISASDVYLKDTTIRGDLLIASTINEGNVDLDNVTVIGKTIINGGGVNSIHYHNGNVGNIHLDKPIGQETRIIIDENASIDSITVESNCIVDESKATKPGNVTIEQNSTLKLIGKLDSVEVRGQESKVIIENATINTLKVADTAKNSTINIAKDSSVQTVSVKSDVAIAGEGQIGKVSVEAANVNLNVQAGNVNSLEVTKDAKGAVVNVDQNAKVTSLTLNAAADIKGKGEIEKASVNVAGTTIEQKPTNLSISTGISTLVSGNTETGTASTRGSSGGGSSSTVTISRVAELSDLKVVNGTAANAIGLPSTVNITLSNSTTTSAEVAWDTTSYNGSAAGSYTLTGTITLPTGVTNPSGIKASVNVIVANPVLRATVAAKTVPVQGKVILTVAGGAADENHKIYYRVVDTDPTAINIGDTIAVGDWAEVTNIAGQEVSAVDGKYVEVVEVTTADSKVTNWGKSAITDDGYAVSSNIVVENLNDSGEGSLRQAIIDVADGGTVAFGEGVAGTIQLGSAIDINKNITITGSSDGGVIVSGQGSSRIFNIAANKNVEISYLKFTKGTDNTDLYLDDPNDESNFGGAIHNAGNLTVNYSTFGENNAFCSGGAITSWEGSTLTVNNSTFANNNAGSVGNGGAIYAYLNSNVTINNSTFTGNSATADGFGGAIWIESGNLVVNNSTISGNTAGSGGGICSGAGTNISLKNTIVSDNGTEDIVGSVIADHSLISKLTSCNLVGGSNNITGQSANLGALASNGGITETMMPNPGSPVIDAGDDSEIAQKDQIGNLRNKDNHVDIGAVESVGLAAPAEFTVNTPTSADNGTNDDGKSSVTVTWTDSATATVDHYEIVAKVGSAPAVTDTVEGKTNIAKGTQTASFGWAAGEDLYVGVVAVDANGEKTLCSGTTANVAVAADGHTVAPTAPAEFTVNTPTSADNGTNDDGKSSVTVTWTDSETATVDHYEIVAKVGSAPAVTDTVEGKTNIVKGTQTASFEWAAGEDLYVGVVAVDANGEKTLCSGTTANVAVAADGHTAVPTAATGLTVTVSAEELPEISKVNLTVPQAADAEHKIYYRVVSSDPAAMNVGEVITLGQWKAVPDTNAQEISAADGEYVEVVEVTTVDNKVTRWGKSTAVDDGVIIVTNLADDGAGSLRDAIASAAPGSTISFADDLLGGGDISIQNPINIDKDIRIIGLQNEGRIYLDGQGQNQIFIIASNVNVEISNLGIRRSNDISSDFCGAIYNQGELTIDNVSFEDNVTYSFGGAIESDNGSILVVKNSYFINNRADGQGTSGGAIYAYNSNATIDNCSFDSNQSGNQGGAIYADEGTIVVKNSRFSNNTAVGGGANIVTVGGAQLTDEGNYFADGDNI